MEIILEVKLTPAQVAEAFCELDDEQQTDVFIEVGKIASKWVAGGSMQWFNLGRHLRDCSCSTWEARNIIEGIFGGMERE